MNFPRLRLFRSARHLLLWAMALVLAAAASPWIERGATADRCHAAGGVASFAVSLPHVAARLEAGEPVTVVALGSSSTQGVGATRPENSYPSRLEAELRQRFGTEVRVLNRGVGGDSMRAMTDRIERDVIAAGPDLVIWQVGTNDMLHAIAAAGLAEGVPVFRRFQVMHAWNDTGVMPIEAALADDRLHMNDRSYGCLARLLADGIATAAR